MKKNSTMERLIGPFELIARTYSKKWNIRVIPSGTTLATNGEVIYFPWNMNEIKGVSFDVLNGHLDHEVGHIREERRHQKYGRKTCLEIVNELKDRKKNTICMLFNFFEDIRMERQYAKEYLGISENLRAANIHGAKECMSREDNCFWHSFGCCIYFEALGLGSDFFDDKYFPYIELCREEIDASRETNWAEEALELARKVYTKVSEYAEDLIEKKKEKKKRDKKEKSDSFELISEPSEPSGDDSEDGDSDDEDGEGDEEPSKEKSSTEKEEVKTAKDALKESTITDYMDAGKKKIEEESEKTLKKLRQYIPNPDVLKKDAWEYPAFGDPEKFFRLKAEVASQTKALRTKLSMRFRALTDARESYDQEWGRLDETSLSQLRVGEKRVFGITTPGITVSTAVSIVIDQSGSMGDSSFEEHKSPAHYARLSAIALAEALGPLKIPFEVIGFDNDSSVRIPHSSHFVNRTPFRYDVYKAFHESYRRVGSRMVYITGKQDNADGEAIFACAKRLAERSEKRKMMFVFSDGSPCCSGLGAEGSDYLEEVVRKITNAGIEVFGMGLQTDSVKRYYSESNGAKWVNIANLENLASDLFKTMGKKLVEGLKEDSKHA